MGDICRLCCSTKFVNNNIFDEASALYLKMSLYLPIKIFNNDQLPQKICDKCSCKVNDFYQFCSEVIEVEHRLHSLLLSKTELKNDLVDLTIVKGTTSPLPTKVLYCHKSTQTEDTYVFSYSVQVKEEPNLAQLSPVKEENTLPDQMDAFEDRSSDSEDMSLINLKKKKTKKLSVNGDVGDKKTRNKKGGLVKLENLMKSLPGGTEVSVVDTKDLTKFPLDTVKVEVEMDEDSQKEVDVYHCCICFMKCYNRNEMLQHYRVHVKEPSASEPPSAPPPPAQEPLRCTRCQKEVRREEWAAHWARHWVRDRRPYRCALCEKAFRDHHQILKHGLTHNFEDGAELECVDKRFVCDLCPEAFVYMRWVQRAPARARRRPLTRAVRRYLLSHRAHAHPEAAGRALTLRCGVCARHFAHINSLRRHLRAHTGERNYLCNVCGKALSSREHLKFHIRIHTGYKPNVCKTCGKGFVKKCNLTLHERVHSGEKPHVCSHCGKAFSQRSTLVIHERYHSGARPYVCGLCGRGFVAKGLLSMHLKSTCI